MYTIEKKFGPYSAAHHLTTVPAGHQCGNHHGHNYEIELELASEQLNEHGFVVDYGDLKVFDEYAKGRMDHKDLNKQFDFSPTAENLAKHFYDWIAGTTSWPIVAVRVSETPGKTMSEYRRPAPVPTRHLHINLNAEIPRTALQALNFELTLRSIKSILDK